MGGGVEDPGVGPCVCVRGSGTGGGPWAQGLAGAWRANPPQVTFHLTLNLSDPASAWTPMEDESNNQEERGISRWLSRISKLTEMVFWVVLNSLSHSPCTTEKLKMSSL